MDLDSARARCVNPFPDPANTASRSRNFQCSHNPERRIGAWFVFADYGWLGPNGSLQKTRTAPGRRVSINVQQQVSILPSVPNQKIKYVRVGNWINIRIQRAECYIPSIRTHRCRCGKTDRSASLIGLAWNRSGNQLHPVVGSGVQEDIRLLITIIWSQVTLGRIERDQISGRAYDRLSSRKIAGAHSVCVRRDEACHT